MKTSLFLSCLSLSIHHQLILYFSFRQLNDSTDPVAREGFGPFLESIGSRCPRSSSANASDRLIRYK